MFENPKKTKVLVVEDKESYQDEWEWEMQNRVVTLKAYTVSEGRRLFDENPDIDVVVMDACVPGDEPTTIPLVRYMRQTFKGPMVAASSSGYYRKQLIDAGCDFEAEKIYVPEAVFRALKISNKKS